VAFGPPRATFAVSGRGPSGLLFPSSPRGSETGGAPLIGLSVSSKPCCPTAAAACANATAPLLGFRAPSARDGNGRPLRPGGHHDPPKPAALRVSHPLDGLLHPNPCEAHRRRLSCERRRVPAALLGFPGSLSLARIFRSKQGEPAPGFLSTVFSSPAMSTCWRALPSCASSRVSCRSRQGSTRRIRRALQGIDRRRVGVSRSSEPRAPTVLRFPADLHTGEFRSSTGSPGLPRHVPTRVTARHPATSRNLSRPYL